MKTALITGANRGIGLACAKLFIDNDFFVFLGVRDLSNADAFKDLPKDKYEVVVLDVSDQIAVKEAVNKIKARNKGLSVLVNNAAILNDYDVNLIDVQITDFHSTLETNLLGPLMLIQSCLPLMRKNNYGRIVNVSSMWGANESMTRQIGSYKISKLALNGLTRIIADELKDTNIKINSICPGWVQTRMGGQSAPRSSATAAKGILWAATIADDGPTGGFFRDGKEITW